MSFLNARKIRDSWKLYEKGVARHWSRAEEMKNLIRFVPEPDTLSDVLKMTLDEAEEGLDMAIKAISEIIAEFNRGGL